MFNVLFKKSVKTLRHNRKNATKDPGKQQDKLSSWIRRLQFQKHFYFVIILDMLSAYMFHLTVLNVNTYVTMVHLGKLNYCGYNGVNWIAWTSFRLYVAFSNTYFFSGIPPGTLKVLCPLLGFLCCLVLNNISKNTFRVFYCWVLFFLILDSVISLMRG